MSTKIEWTEETWNPFLGCSEASTGCKNCYAKVMSHRLGHNPKTADRYKGLTHKKANRQIDFTGVVKLNEEALLKPLKRKKPTMYFVNSMSDLFHQNVPFEWIDKVFAVMALCPQHTFQILTKRADRMYEYFESTTTYRAILQRIKILEEQMGNNFYENEDNYLLKNKLPLPNVWLGVSAENQTQADKRIPYLLKTPAAVRFVSAEPLLGGIDFEGVYDKENDLIVDTLLGERFCTPDDHDALDYHSDTNKLDWIIVGGESGHHARPMHPEWVRSIRNQCKAAGVAFFFKQWGNCLPLTQQIDLDASLNADLHLNEFGDLDMLASKRGRWVGFAKVDKAKAGNYLDGVQHLEMPNL